MLVLNRSTGQRIFIGKDIIITVGKMHGGKVQIGIDAPRNVPVNREETAPKEQRAERAAE